MKNCASSWIALSLLEIGVRLLVSVSLSINLSLEKFHLPKSLLLALAGEIGELTEIFQWKKESLSQKERIHLGEELSDVLIYSVRFCDTVGVDLSSLLIRLGTDREYVLTANNLVFSPSWSSLSFEELRIVLVKELEVFGTVNVIDRCRSLLFRVWRHMGDLSHAADAFPDCSVEEASEWKDSDRLVGVVQPLTHMLLCIHIIALLCDVSLPLALGDKVRKNHAKYPVELVKGKSNKYSEYSTTT